MRSSYWGHKGFRGEHTPWTVAIHGAHSSWPLRTNNEPSQWSAGGLQESLGLDVFQCIPCGYTVQLLLRPGSNEGLGTAQSGL
ncbi:hypothetical protein I79_009826 [Cricetulus griseus]|uniref:Uncharacterized protein n=1 Tax=Cricetulus griseus TaxID=10029 RepID=G3HGT5_CRIGR|nr:hypothetical protein I79_009826 [Cricetulus griseus]